MCVPGILMGQKLEENKLYNQAHWGRALMCAPSHIKKKKVKVNHIEPNCFLCFISCQLWIQLYFLFCLLLLVAIIILISSSIQYAGGFIFDWELSFFPCPGPFLMPEFEVSYNISFWPLPLGRKISQMIEIGSGASPHQPGC